MEIHLEAGDVCPKCKNKLDAVTPVGRPATKAEKGDYTVCAYCGAALRFTDNKGHLRAITDEEEEKMDDETRDMLNGIQSAIKARNRSRFAM
jgi:transcription initiation factor IIE alpha subunit